LDGPEIFDIRGTNDAFHSQFAIEFHTFTVEEVAQVVGLVLISSE
jgi:hypothetical protein